MFYFLKCMKYQLNPLLENVSRRLLRDLGNKPIPFSDYAHLKLKKIIAGRDFSKQAKSFKANKLRLFRARRAADIAAKHGLADKADKYTNLAKKLRQQDKMLRDPLNNGLILKDKLNKYNPSYDLDLMLSKLEKENGLR